MCSRTHDRNFVKNFGGEQPNAQNAIDFFSQAKISDYKKSKILCQIALFVCALSWAVKQIYVIGWTQLVFVEKDLLRVKVMVWSNFFTRSRVLVCFWTNSDIFTVYGEAAGLDICLLASYSLVWSAMNGQVPPHREACLHFGHDSNSLGPVFESTSHNCGPMQHLSDKLSHHPWTEFNWI